MRTKTAPKQVNPHLIQIGNLKLGWNDCVKCDIGRSAIKHVLFEAPKGAQSLDVLFVGEGPGRVEDLYGLPFKGPAGQLLRDGITEARSWHKGCETLRIGFTNLVACRPTDDGNTNRQPSSRECANCAPRLAKVVEIFDPIIIVLCGRIPERYWKFTADKVGWVGTVRNIQHPAYIVRIGGRGSNAYNKWVEEIREILFEAWEYRS